MANYKVNRYISLDLKSHSLPRYRKEYLNQHSKFIHASWLLKEDIDREVTLNDIKYTIFGIWEVVNSKYNIMLKPVEGGPFYIADSKAVANALGYVRMRNLVTGEEHKSDLIGKRKNLITMLESESESINLNEEEEDNLSEWDNSPQDDLDEEDGEGDIDPITQALQDDLTDDGDTSNY